MDEPISFVRILSLYNDLIMPWLDLYETAFPPNERILVSSILKRISDNHNAPAKGIYTAAILNQDNQFIGMSMVELPAGKPVGILWYVAVTPGQRSRGWGSKIYRGIVSQINPEIYKALVFEVEIPGQPDSSPEAERRIRFYQKNGARLLTGIHYLQSVGWHQPPTPMHIMIHPLQPMDAETAYEMAKSIFGASLQKTGVLALK
jgi:ribosomal protein S18 acetylase RimI-like enzyme